LQFQDVLFAFNPTAQTINPSDLTFSVKYSMKKSAQITDSMLKNNYAIEVSTLTHSSSVSGSIKEYYTATGTVKLV